MLKRVLKWIGIVLGVIIGLVIVLVVVANLISMNRLGKTYTVAALPAIMVSDDAETIADGARLYHMYFCADCHGDNLAGMEVINNPFFGNINSANLTAGTGGIGSTYSDEDYARSIWYGVAHSGRPLVIMPSEMFHRVLNADDVGNLVSYIRSMPAVDNDAPDVSPGIALRVFHAANMFPVVPAEVLDLNTPPQYGNIEPDATVEYGEYRAQLCTSCHGENLTGNPTGGGNLTPHESGLGGWTEDEFTQVLRTNTRRDGSTIEPDERGNTAHAGIALLTDDEITAVWMYLQTLEPVAME